MIIDLSMLVNEQSIVFPGDAKPKFEQAGTMTTTNFVDHVVHVNNHLGTHIDAPGHMVEGGKFLEEVAIARFVCQAVCIDVRGKELTARLLEDIEIKAGEAVIFYTGASDYNTQANYADDYLDFGVDLAEALIERKVNMVGVDMISYDHNEPYPIHKKLLGAEIILIENLTNLLPVVGKRFKLYALPIRFELEAAPARVIAELED